MQAIEEQRKWRERTYRTLQSLAAKSSCQRLIRRAVALEPDNHGKLDGLAEAQARAAKELARLDGMAPGWHGESPDAAIDSIVRGGINGVQPPYTVRVTGTAALSPEIRQDIERLAKHIAEHREDHRQMHGRDVEVALELIG